MIKSKKLQNFYINFEQQLSTIMKEEIKNNKEQINTILKYPYPKPKAERVSKSLEAISSEVYNFSKVKQQK